MNVFLRILRFKTTKLAKFKLNFNSSKNVLQYNINIGIFNLKHFIHITKSYSNLDLK